jgi:F-type H+-transporting ATPase subunit b
MAEASAETTATTAAPEASGGMPQFDFAVWPGQIAWALIIFVGLYVVLSRALLPKVKAAIEARDAKIKGDMDEARRLRDEAGAQAEAATREIAEARARAARTASEAKSKAAEETKARQQALEAELNKKIGEAEASIAKSRDAAMANVRTIAADTAAAIAEKLTGQAPEAADVQSALDAATSAN